MGIPYKIEDPKFDSETANATIKMLLEQLTTANDEIARLKGLLEGQVKELAWEEYLRESTMNPSIPYRSSPSVYNDVRDAAWLQYSKENNI